MNNELLDNIELLQNNIEEMERDCESALLKGDFEAMYLLRNRITEMKNELSVLELRLLDTLPSRRK